jgi:septal ring factor EnvC (AmiA/AmiB activator)
MNFVIQFGMSILLYALSAIVPVVLADDLKDKSHQLKDLQQQIKQITQELNDLNHQKSGIYKELKQLEQEYGELARTAKSLTDRIVQHKSDLQEISRKIERILEKMDTQKESIAKEVKASYALGKNEQLRFILNQQASDVSRINNYYQYYSRARTDKVNIWREDVAKLSALKDEMQVEQAGLQTKLEQQAQTQQTLLEKKAQRQQTLERIQKQAKNEKQKLISFREDEQKLKKLIQSLERTLKNQSGFDNQGKPFGKLQGQLNYPVAGQILKQFGDARSESRWDGVLIKAEEGQEVRAVAQGKVVYADWLRGYGLLTIIDHGGGYMTLYAFNQSLYKSVGDTVTEGTVVASVGQSGGQIESSLYFSIRRNGKPLNPQKWLRKKTH